MGNMKPIDSAVVKNETYDVLSADTMGGEYIETIGAACQNPDGYTSGSLFLGKDNDVQHLYRATAAIALGETIILDTNCVYTTVSGELEGKAEESEVTSLNEALTNEVSARAELGAHNLIPLNLEWIKAHNTNGTWAGNVYTYLGLTYTINTNSNGEVIGIRVNGTANGGNSQLILSQKDFGGTIMYSYTGSGASDRANGYVISGGEAVNESASFMLVYYTDHDIGIRTVNGTVINNKDVYPMMRLDTDPSPDFTPYAMTNRELTEDVSPLLNFLPGDSIAAPNLDNFSDTGFFSVNSATNKPSGTSARGVVINIKASNTSSYLVQLYLALHSTEATKLFVRNKYEGTWNSWTQIQ